MTPLEVPKEYKIGKEVTIRNHLDGQIFAALYKGVISIDMTKCRPPVIVTLSPGMKLASMEDLRKIQGEITADPIRRPRLGPGKA